MWSVPSPSLAVDGLVAAFSMAEGKIENYLQPTLWVVNEADQINC